MGELFRNEMPRRRFLPHLIVAAVLLFAFAASSGAAVAMPLPDGPNDYNSPGFVVRHAWLKFGYLATEPFRGKLSRREEDAKVARYFHLNEQIADDEQTAGN